MVYGRRSLVWLHGTGEEGWVNGFCGPFSLDMNRREWLAKSAVVVSPVGADKRAEGRTLCAIIRVSS